jgi:hypothetical protein
MNSNSTVSVPMVDTYITSLSLKERKAYLIAKSHLDMSFDLEKSIGFKQFLQKNKEVSSEEATRSVCPQSTFGAQGLRPLA